MNTRKVHIMFTNLITEIENQIAMLNQKKNDLLPACQLSESVLDDIRRVLVIVEPYAEEKQQFIDSILQIVNVDSQMLVNYRSQPETQENKNNIDSEFPIHQTHKMFDYQGKHYVYFQNGKSKNGSNSVKTWETHIKNSYPHCKVSSVKLDNPVSDGRFLLVLENCSDDVIAYLRSVDFSVRPENQIDVSEYSSTAIDDVVDSVEEAIVEPVEKSFIYITEEVVEPIAEQPTVEDNEEVAEPIDYFPEVDEVEEEIYTEYCEPVEDDNVLQLQRLESNSRVAKNPLKTTELYIGFDKKHGFASESNLELWDNYLDKEHSSIITEPLDNWNGSGVEGNYLLKVVSTNITKLMELVKYDYTATPMVSKLNLGEITEVKEETTESEDRLTQFIRSLGHEPDDAFDINVI